MSSKSTAAANAPDAPDAPESPESEKPAPTEKAATRSPEELSADERALLSRHYRALRLAQSPGDAEEAREKIRALQGPDAEIGDHVVICLDGSTHRTEYAGATKINGSPVLSVYEDVL